MTRQRTVGRTLTYWHSGTRSPPSGELPGRATTWFHVKQRKHPCAEAFAPPRQEQGPIASEVRRSANASPGHPAQSSSLDRTPRDHLRAPAPDSRPEHSTHPKLLLTRSGASPNDTPVDPHHDVRAREFRAPPRRPRPPTRARAPAKPYRRGTRLAATRRAASSRLQSARRSEPHTRNGWHAPTQRQLDDSSFAATRGVRSPASSLASHRSDVSRETEAPHPRPRGGPATSRETRRHGHPRVVGDADGPPPSREAGRGEQVRPRG